MKFVDVLLDLSKSPVLKSALTSMDKLIDSINEQHKIEPIPIASLVGRFSQDTDRIILGFEQAEKISFIGGQVVVLKDQEDPDSFLIRLDLYYQKSPEGVILKQLSRRMPRALLTSDSIAELDSGADIKFEVTDPERK